MKSNVTYYYPVAFVGAQWQNHWRKLGFDKIHRHQLRRPSSTTRCEIQRFSLHFPIYTTLNTDASNNVHALQDPAKLKFADEIIAYLDTFLKNVFTSFKGDPVKEAGQSFSGFLSRQLIACY